MNVNQLFSGRFDQYFAAAHRGDPLWLFVHVPKTAGSSLNGEMAPILSPGHHIFIDYAQLDPREAGRSYEELFDSAVDQFIAQAREKRFRYCTGHINATQVSRIVAQVPDVRPVTLLREPVARFVSDFRYQRSAMHPGHEDFRARYPTIRDYLRAEGEWNKFATTLLPPDLRRRGDTAGGAAWLIDTYKFIGLQEYYGLSLHALSWFAGVPKRSRVRRRINEPTPDNDVALTAELRADIAARNWLDVALHGAVAPRFIGIADGLAAYLDRVAPRPPST